VSSFPSSILASHVNQIHRFRKLSPETVRPLESTAQVESSESASELQETSAHRLYDACQNDVMPSDPAVLEDYGFNRCSYPEKTQLLGLYQGLTLMSRWMRPTALELHEERLRGNLVERIITTFEKIKDKDARGGYFPWFLKNRYILAGLPGQKG
jgi:hypothetical protein